jgi:hypothetical protein
MAAMSCVSGSVVDREWHGELLWSTTDSKNDPFATSARASARFRRTAIELPLYRRRAASKEDYHFHCTPTRFGWARIRSAERTDPSRAPYPVPDLADVELRLFTDRLIIGGLPERTVMAMRVADAHFTGHVAIPTAIKIAFLPSFAVNSIPCRHAGRRKSGLRPTWGRKDRSENRFRFSGWRGRTKSKVRLPPVRTSYASSTTRCLPPRGPTSSVGCAHRCA